MILWHLKFTSIKLFKRGYEESILFTTTQSRIFSFHDNIYLKKKLPEPLKA